MGLVFLDLANQPQCLSCSLMQVTWPLWSLPQKVELQSIQMTAPGEHLPRTCPSTCFFFKVVSQYSHTNVTMRIGQQQLLILFQSSNNQPNNHFHHHQILILQAYSEWAQSIQTPQFIQINLLQIGWIAASKLKKIYNQSTNLMSVGEIILDPISILQMTNYFEKNIPKSRGGATFGFIYAKQVELKFLISLTAPLGTHLESVQQLLKRGRHFENIRKTKSKTTQSYFLEYELVGLYLMRKQYEKQEQKLKQLSFEYSKLGAPFSLVVKVDEGIDVKFMKDSVNYPYTSEMQTNEKICVDSFSNQNTKSLVTSTVRKEALMISHFNEKISQLLEKVQKNALNELELIQLAESLDNYDRIKQLNSDNKLKTIQALNYSVLVGLSVSRTIG